MKYLLALLMTLAITSQSDAEVYSWVDDSGTYNYTENFSGIPARYQKKVNRHGDMGKDASSQVPSPSPQEMKAEPAAKAPVAPPDAAPADDNQLFEGKSYADWRKEFEVQEAELKILEQQLDQLQKRSTLPQIQFKAEYLKLKKDFDDTKAIYDQKYKVYSELIESARKAGLKVNIKQ